MAGTAVALSCCCIKHTGQDSRATQQKQTACLMLDQQLKPKPTAQCPSDRDFKTTLVAVETPATTPVGSLIMTTSLGRQRRLTGGYNTWAMRQHQRHRAAPKAAVLVGNNSNAFDGSKAATAPKVRAHHSAQLSLGAMCLGPTARTSPHESCSVLLSAASLLAGRG